MKGMKGIFIDFIFYNRQFNFKDGKRGPIKKGQILLNIHFYMVSSFFLVFDQRKPQALQSL
jgi:hypothetical protein